MNRAVVDSGGGTGYGLTSPNTAMTAPGTPGLSAVMPAEDPSGPAGSDITHPRTSSAELRQITVEASRRKYFVLGALCVIGWAGSVAFAAFIDCGADMHRVGLACHILALVLSFGAILVVDWVGFLWLLGKRDIHDTRRLEAAAQPLIWGGLAVLLVSGALIKPDITNPMTQIKLLCVLVLMLNGIALAPAMKQLHALPAGTHFTAVAKRLRLRLLVALCISQGCWWTSVLVGLLNSTLRRWAGD
ncbi:hypothetical protein [Arthrobacter sp. M4]|uniref:hypothetical protein n=1 Tax=Arthrobacter sp. M4 TaxID=218160 RepID=UPI001CDBF31A|nr:hypothetical protein [Arthrobacter sp. M4]MCA4132973.1 hypothetical protein [Arthrobacter sp. M4]